MIVVSATKLSFSVKQLVPHRDSALLILPSFDKRQEIFGNVEIKFGRLRQTMTGVRARFYDPKS